METVDLFSGCGGLSLGFQNAGYNVLAAFDNWQPAVNVYRDNFAHPIFENYISAPEVIDMIRGYAPELIIGGPPCQDFSSAGKRDETLGRADLTIRFAEIINAVRPEFFVMENVERITKSRALVQALQIFHQAGYSISKRVLDASYCGVPQSRKRFFVVGHLNSVDGFLEQYIERNLSPTPMTVFDYLGNSLGLEYYYRHPRSYQRRGVFSIHEPSPTIRGVNRPMPRTYQRHPGDPIENFNNIRQLTTVERSFIQTFPENFIWNGTNKTDLEQMIGNAVPPRLGEFVANCILQYRNDVQNGNFRMNRVNALELF